MKLWPLLILLVLGCRHEMTIDREQDKDLLFGMVYFGVGVVVLRQDDDQTRLEQRGEADKEAAEAIKAVAPSATR